MTKLFLIPAKKNSRGIKNKNLIKINGKSLVERTLKESFSSKLTDLIYVSSDSEDILDIATEYNAIPIKRPKKFCSNNSNANSVILHFISVLPDNLIRTNPWIFYLQPTSPLRKKKHLIEVCKLLKKNKPIILETEILQLFLQTPKFNENLQFEIRCQNCGSSRYQAINIGISD